MAGGQHGRRGVDLHDEVRDWYESLDERSQERVTEVVELLVEQGERLRMPHSRSLGEGLQELRVSLRDEQCRITYWFAPRRVIVLLTAFRKQRQVEQREVERARQAQRDCEANHHPDEQED